MDVGEPRVRRRGFFLHSDPNEPDTGDHDNAEGFTVRIRVDRSQTPRQFSSGRRSQQAAQADSARPAIRSGSVTGSRQRSHLPR